MSCKSSISKIITKSVALIGLTLLCNEAVASGEPALQCDFATQYANGQTTFDYYSVISCLNSVPFNRADVQNTVDVALYWMEQSTPAAAYDAQVNWRRAINRLNRHYDSDFEFQQAAAQAVENTLKNAHYNYIYPACYRAFRAIQPLAFGSRISQGQQIIFVEGTVARDAYQAKTGIDAEAFVGKKVVSINGVKTLRFLKKWARNRGRWDRDLGNELDRVLMSNTYSIRGGSLVFPERRRNVYVLEDRWGRRQRVVLPWIFEVQSPSFLRDSVEELVEFCTEPNPLVANMEEAMSSTTRAEDMSPGARALIEGLAQGFKMGVDMESKDEGLRRRRKTHHRNNRGFVEIPERQRGILLEDFDPPLRIRGWTALKYNGGEATVIQIANQFDLLPDTIGLLQQATDYACTNSDRVIVDLRGNPGGILLEADVLTHYFYPDLGVTADRNQSFGPGTTAYQVLQNQYWTDVIYGAGIWTQTVGEALDSCGTVNGFEPGCFVNVKTGSPLDSLAWYTTTSIERLGGRDVALNPSFHFRTTILPFYTPLAEIQCPGRFEQDRLVVLTDGRTCSTSFQLANQLSPRATNVSIGGLVGEDKAIGVCRGGNVTDINFLTFFQELVTTTLDSLGVDGTQLNPPVSPGPNTPLFNRNVNMRVELWAARNADQTEIVAETPPLGARPNIIVRTWQDVFDEDTNGFVYRKVLRAVKRRAQH